MKQHPLPQNISSYKFHLIGSMTLKQFLFLAGGIIIAWLIYSLPLLFIFKWPLIVLVVIIGIAVAFVPYQDRPLDQWFSSFIKAIYHPTKLHWKKSSPPPSYLQPSKVPTSSADLKLKTSPVSVQDKLSSYLSSLSPDTAPSPLEKSESSRLKQINDLIISIAPFTTPSPKTTPSQPTLSKNLKVEVRKLKSPPPKNNFLATKPSLTPPPPQTPSPPKPTKSTLQKTKTSSSLPSLTPKPSSNLKDVTINPSLPFPSTPTSPNIIVGMTLDPKRNILENAIIEIRDQNGYPVRALKSNRLGQFFIATPLKNGVYEIDTEKENYEFKPLRIKLEGKIVPPIEIRAQPKQTLQPPTNPPTTTTSPATL